MSKAQGQFTIIDYNDALTLTGYIGSNLVKTQMYNPDNDSYTPDWTSTNLVLTPSLYVIGTTTDQITSSNITSVKWYEGTSTTAITASDTYTLGTKSSNYTLTVKDNTMSGVSGIDYRCDIVYHDDSTDLDLTYTMSISFSRVVNGSGIVDLLVYTPSGNVFKNSEVTSLTAVAQLWRGSTIDTSNVSYLWAIMDSSVTSSSSTGYNSTFGTGWRYISSTTAVDGGTTLFSGYTTSTLTVYADAIDSYGVIKCIATDTDSTSSTYNSTYMDVATFIDNADPIQVVIESTGGDVFKNGEGSTVLTARVYQAGSEIDTAGAGSYTWTKYDKNGTLISTFSKTGKTLSVGGDDVDTKATFMVVVEI